MARFKTYLLAAATIFAALAIGFVMQRSETPPRAGLEGPDPVEITAITDTSSAATPRLPAGPQLAGVMLPGARVELTAAEAPDAGAQALPRENAAGGFDCAIDMSAEPRAGALAVLTVSAPCYASERLTIHHQGLMFTEVMQPDGTLQVDVPVLAERALFIASFDNGEGATATAEVTSLPFYDRVVLQWKGDTGLQLHAREFGADYFTEGHVWAASSGDITRAAQGEGGFFVRLGDDETPGARIAEVYTFPAQTAQRDGTVEISVEAEVTETTCDRTVEAQTLEHHGDAGLKVRDMSLDMPACDSAGDFLLLKNMIEDLTIAAR
ncbi:hypothetical protein [Salipiger mucosus]|uniref:Translocase n=1 Tax=Salipiger mucosus DSM 16094 TaxID=1123237 RepID=S9QLJ9_9RHOB|nr:hypothetical protein [Salipiger mucosus]EPX82351.1 hypothetical protein Salmuc_04076 [Salipiger mucosus DSM 16094]